MFRRLLSRFSDVSESEITGALVGLRDCRPAREAATREEGDIYSRSPQGTSKDLRILVGAGIKGGRGYILAIDVFAIPARQRTPEGRVHAAQGFWDGWDPLDPGSRGGSMIQIQA
jgi:hypothetical protein